MSENTKVKDELLQRKRQLLLRETCRQNPERQTQRANQRMDCANHNMDRANRYLETIRRGTTWGKGESKTGEMAWTMSGRDTHLLDDAASQIVTFRWFKQSEHSVSVLI